jgi:hypothetical protein
MAVATVFTEMSPNGRRLVGRERRGPVVARHVDAHVVEAEPREVLLGQLLDGEQPAPMSCASVPCEMA